MNAGNLNISVQAEMSALEAQFTAIEKAFTAAGARAAAAFKVASTDAAKSIGGGPSDEIVDLLAEPAKEGISKGIDSGVKEAVRASVPAAKSLGEAIGKEASKSLAPTLGERLKNEFSDQKLGKMLGAAMGLGAADNMVREIASVIRGDKSIPDAIASLFKSVPVMGALTEFGEAISTRIFVGDPVGDAEKRKRTIADEAAMLLTQTNVRLDKQQADRNRALAHEKRISEMRGKDEALLDVVQGKRLRMIEENVEREADLRAEAAVERALLSGDKIKAIEIERDREIEREREKFRQSTVHLHELQIEDELGKQNLQWEMDNLKAASDERVRLIEIEHQLKMDLQDIEDQESKRKRMEALDEERKKRIEVLNEEREAAAEQFEKDIRSSARVGSVSTAIGEFKFSAYPEAEKRRMDQMALDTLRGILNKIDAQVRTTQEATFA